MPRFPIHLMDKEIKLPETGVYYVVGKNGVFLHKDTGFITALVKVEKISVLDTVATYAKLRLPKIPVPIMSQVVPFFRYIYKLYGSEALVLLYFSTEKQEFLVDAMKQEVSSAGVKYKFETKQDLGFQLVGSIHSHANFSAFHSGVDERDERDFDGLHITVGHNGRKRFSLSSSIVVNNNRFLVPSDTVIDGLLKSSFDSTPIFKGFRPVGNIYNPHFKAPIRLNSNTLGKFGDDNEIDLRPEIIAVEIEPEYTKPEKGEFYDLIFSSGEGYRTYPFPRQWIEEVEHASFFGMKKHIDKIRKFIKTEKQEKGEENIQVLPEKVSTTPSDTDPIANVPKEVEVTKE